jgi:aminomethyltransferase
MVLMDAGSDLGILPAGLGARDTLRLEKAYPLYGFELNEATTPLEAGLEWVVKFSKEFFLGRESLLKQREAGVPRKLIGLQLMEPGIARTHCSILKDGRVLGEVTSGTKSPTLRKAVALGYVESAEAGVGNALEVEIRGRRVAAEVVPLPFYRRLSTRQSR